MTDSCTHSSRLVPPAALALAVLAFSGAAAAGAQQAPAPGERQFGEETTVTVVEVPVQVLRDGEPVRGLTADDFVIYDEGERRPVQFFEAVDLQEMSTAQGGTVEAAPAAATEVPAAARRHFLLFFDLDFTEPTFVGKAQQAALHLVRDGLEPTDLVGVAFFHGRSGASSVIGFTSDRGQVIEALKKLGELVGEEEDGEKKGTESSGRRLAGDALGLTFGGWDVAAAEIGRASIAQRSLADEALAWVGGGEGKRGSATETIADMAAYAEEDMRQGRAGKASALMAALQVLARQTRFIDGAKYLLLFSQGFESYLYTDRGGSWLYSDIEKAMEELRRAGWSIHGIEAAAVWSDRRPKQKRETLALLAEQTGGEVYWKSADLTEAVGKVLKRTSVTYVLGFQTGEIPMDGSFRKLRVELAHDAGGARLLHRTGYFTPRRTGTGDDETWRADAGELLLTGEERDEIGTALVAAPMRLTPGGARVPVMVEIDGSGLFAGSDAPARTDLYVYAFGSGGAVEAARSRELLLDPARLPAAGGGFKVLERLDLPPGEHQVRVLVRNADTGAVALRVARMTVPEPGAAPPTMLLPPVFLQESGEPWVLVREDEGGDFPFTFHNHRFLPAAGPAVEKDHDRTLLILGYGLPADGKGLRVRVVDALGKPVEGASFALEAREPGGPGAPDALALRLSPKALAPGLYQVEVAVSGVTPWTRSARFRVVAGSGS